MVSSSLGGPRDPKNTRREVRAALDRAGFGWVTSHSFRKATATTLEEAGLSARVIADQLGHARPSATAACRYDHHWARVQGRCATAGEAREVKLSRSRNARQRRPKTARSTGALTWRGLGLLSCDQEWQPVVTVVVQRETQTTASKDELTQGFGKVM